MDLRPGHEYTEETVKLNVNEDTSGASGGHGGGDVRMVADFVSLLRGETPSISSTSIEDSVAGHLLGFGADCSREENRVVPIDVSDI